MRHRAFTLGLAPTRRQTVALTDLLGHLADMYNAALQERRDAWKTQRVHVSAYEQMRELTQLRATVPVFAQFPVTIQRDPIRRVDRAFAGFFRRCRSGETPGYPRFRSKDRYDSFVVDGPNFSIKHGRVSIVKLGSFRVRTRCRLSGEPKQLFIKRVGHKWIAVVTCAIGAAPEKRPVSTAVGIDVGLTHLVTCSDGTTVENPRWTREAATRLARANQALARKTRGSSNRKKARERLRRVHQAIAGRRRAYLHGVSRDLIARYDLIAYEDLKIRSMVKSNLGKSIMDAAWGELIHQLKYKAEDAGSWVVPVNPRGTSQMCSGCGETVKKDLPQRTHSCPSCGLILDRDHNAALNILARGERAVGREAAEGSL